MILGDCMDLMTSKPDKYYDLAFADPPYGIEKQLLGGRPFGKKYKSRKWDKKPNPEYFTELFRVSKHQIIFGGNYFELPPSRGFIVWDKNNTGRSFAECEFAWTSFDRVARIAQITYNGFIGQDEIKIHATQKPVELYKWILKRYASEGMKILDTHGGSFSNAIACFDLSFDLDITEIDEDCYVDGKNRVLTHIQKKKELANKGFAISEIKKIHPTLF